MHSRWIYFQERRSDKSNNYISRQMLTIIQVNGASVPVGVDASKVEITKVSMNRDRSDLIVRKGGKKE